MESLGLLDAVGRWGSGQPLDGVALWGLPVPWLGRAGVCLQVLGGLAIVLDLVGPARLRQWTREAAPAGAAEVWGRVGVAARAAWSWRVLPGRHARRAENRWRAARQLRAGEIGPGGYLTVVERDAPTPAEVALVLLGAAVRLSVAGAAHLMIDGVTARVLVCLVVLACGPVGGLVLLWHAVNAAYTLGLRAAATLAARVLAAGGRRARAWRALALTSLVLGLGLTVLAL
ncbi:hypothetical protein LX15_001593 [Streptoalloteichus tenebrarius]|uniref:Uncharacterized protein n=1 Tax=Streptoalloteichus tenebrarius (strain ATCC 17920 / DSM 40477 / JCM 4838 / CBS 697.72 / NBRC 16177 / NCIMB 11028 / NRRL B-12390 / A12253. 1 / ISP 5477) TaxID=1933 RepID=A0ABT1HQW8_STRSD|nr:hypothetical protein [Streptoalloteichus tenebrarius]MCP2257907.1 hypothetical protein [Streptoalloteichus tenebrarius]BFE99728.1 hypothetical protein GCM10020241_14040 [Streptoalloteichus tenebrarius]